MRIVVPVVIEMSDTQVEDYAQANGLPSAGSRLYVPHVVEDVRSYVLTCIQDSAGLGEGAADVSLKGA